MTRLFSRWFIVFLLLLPSVLQFAGHVGAQDDILPDVADGEDDGEASVETDEDVIEGDTAPGVRDSETEKTEEEEEEGEKPLKPSPDAETHILFIKPTGTEFPAGQPVKILVGFANKGDKDFVVETMDAAFRYPQDYSFYIQNFTTYRYYRTVEPAREATFEYSFQPSDTFSARPFGLTVNLNYKDSEGNIFQDAVFNTTINVTELDEGFDGETFFLYIFLAAVAVLIVLGLQQLFTSLNKKHKLVKQAPHHSAPVEMGTQNNKSDVDYDWLPKETLQMNRSPRQSPKGTKTSPRSRTAKRRTGAVDD